MKKKSYTLRKHIDLQRKIGYDDKKIPRKIYIFQKTVQVVDIEQAIV